MTKSDSTLIAVVLDASSSMSTLRGDVVGGFDKFIAEHKKAPGECKITLAQFSGEMSRLSKGIIEKGAPDPNYQIVWNLQDIKNVGSIEPFYVTNGYTALLDAVGRTIESVGQELARRPEHDRPGKVIFCIITDGEENASKKYSKAQVREMIERQKATYSWDFTFLGANVDAFAEADGIGIMRDFALNYAATKKGIGGAFKAVSASALRARNSGTPMNYTTGERAMAMGQDEE